MTAASAGVGAEAQVRELVEGWVEAIRVGNIDARLAGYVPEVLSFDVVDPFQRRGSSAIRERLEAWLAWYDGPVGYEIHDLSVTAADAVAFCHSLNHISGTLRQGGEVDMWVRTTVCFRRIEGQWIVTHDTPRRLSTWKPARRRSTSNPRNDPRLCARSDR